MVTRVWGKADHFELVFSYLGNDHWTANVPADLDDGQYIVELYCCDDAGSIAYWTGILYLNNSESVRVKIVSDKFKVWLDADIGITLSADHNVWLEEDLVLQITFSDYLGRG